MEDLIRELIAAQKEQTEVLRRYLTRVRFSLLSLLLLTTGMSIVLGVVAYRQHTARTATTVVMPAGFGGAVPPALPPNYQPVNQYPPGPALPAGTYPQPSPIPADPKK